MIVLSSPTVAEQRWFRSGKSRKLGVQSAAGSYAHLSQTAMAKRYRGTIPMPSFEYRRREAYRDPRMFTLERALAPPSPEPEPSSLPDSSSEVP